MLRNSLALCLVGLLVLGAGCSKRAKVARLLQRADSSLAAGQPDNAEIDYAKVLQAEPGNRHAIRQLGILYQESGSYGRAAGLLIRARDLEPANLEVRRALAELYLAAGKFKEARLEAEFLLERDPTDARALVVLAKSPRTVEEVSATQARLQTLIERGETGPMRLAEGLVAILNRQPEAARVAFQRALALDPGLSEAHLALGNLQWLTGDLAQAETSLKRAAELAPLRSVARVRYAEFKAKSEGAAAGRAILEELTGQAPDYLPAWLRLAELEFGEDRLEECGALLRKVLARDANHFGALMLSARLRMASQEPAKALAEFQRLNERFPNSPAILYQLGLSRLLNKDVTQAMQHLEEAVRLDPQFAEPQILLGELHLRRGDFAPVVESMEALIARQPRLVQARLLLANAYRAQGDAVKALGVYRDLTEKYPTNPQAPFQMGLMYLGMTNAAEARRAFERALELEQKYLPAIQQLVNLDLAQTNYPAALQRVLAEVEKHPNAVEAQMMLARVYEAQQAWAEMENALQRALELEPEYSPAFMALARMYLSSGDSEGALEKLRAVTEGNPSDLRAWMLIGMFEERAKNFVAARDAYEEVLKIRPNFALALNNLAYVYTEPIPRLDRAYELAEQARNAAPQDPSVADTLGWVYFKRGDYTSALTLLKESARTLESRAEVQAHLGLTHYMLGEEDSARAALARALTLSADFPERSEVESSLAILDIPRDGTDLSAAATLEKRIELKPDDVVALLRLGAIQEKTQAVARAMETYQKAVRVQPRSLPALLALAKLHAGRNETEKALEWARKAREVDGRNSEVAALAGRMALRSGQFQLALGLLQETARMTPSDPDVLYDLGVAYYNVGDIDRGERSLQSALQAEARFARSDSAQEMLFLIGLHHDPSKAAGELDRINEVLDRTPGYVPALMALATAQEQLGGVAKAREIYEGILQRHPLFSPAAKQLTLLYVDHFGMDREAREWGVKARSQFPNDPQLARALGIASFRLQDWEGAKLYLNEAARTLADDSGAVYALGMTLARLKEEADAKRLLERALTLDLDPARTAEARKALEGLDAPE